MEPYRSYSPLSALWLPETEKAVMRVLVLPTGMAVESEAIRKVCQIIRVVAANGWEVHKRLQEQASREKPSLSEKDGEADRWAALQPARE